MEYINMLDNAKKNLVLNSPKIKRSCQTILLSIFKPLFQSQHFYITIFLHASPIFHISNTQKSPNFQRPVELLIIQAHKFTRRPLLSCKKGTVAISLVLGIVRQDTQDSKKQLLERQNALKNYQKVESVYLLADSIKLKSKHSPLYITAKNKLAKKSQIRLKSIVDNRESAAILVSGLMLSFFSTNKCSIGHNLLEQKFMIHLNNKEVDNELRQKTTWCVSFSTFR